MAADEKKREASQTTSRTVSLREEEGASNMVDAGAGADARVHTDSNTEVNTDADADADANNGATRTPGAGAGTKEATDGGGSGGPAVKKFGERPAVFRNTLQEVLFVFQATVATMTSSFLMGASVIVTASIGRDLGMTQSEISWIGAATSLTAGAFQLGLGQLADLLGRKMVFLAGMSSFAAFAVVTGFARNPFWMDVLCGLLGVSAAMVVPPAIGVLGAAYAAPSRRKNVAFAAFSAGNPLGFVAGSIAGGVAARLFNWRAVYFFIAILWAVFALLGVWAVPRVEAYDPGVPLRRRLAGFLHKFDSVGAVLTLFGTGLFSAAITLGPADGWGSAHVIAMLVVGVLLIVIFAFWERTYPYPLMPPHIWRDRNFTFIIIANILGFMSFSAASFWLAFFMQELQNLPPLTVAVHLLPQCVAGLLWNVLAGAILHRVNNTLIMAVGALSYVGANVLLSLMRPDSNYWAFMFPSLVLNVVGADFQFNVANMYVMQSLPSHQQSLAGGIFNTMIRLSTTVALGMTTAVYSSVAATPEGLADPMLKFTRAFQVSVALAGAGVLFVPFIRLGTQGNTHAEKEVAGTVDAPPPDSASSAAGLSMAAESKEVQA